MPTYRPCTPDGLVALCVEAFGARPGIVTGGIDGAGGADPGGLAEKVAAALRGAGRPAAVVHVADFIRPASVRMEFGRTDTESFRTMWFDYAAIDREVIGAVHRSGAWLPRLWDEATDRSPRDRRITAAADQVLIVAGPMLLGHGLSLQPTIALQMSAGALRRSTPDDLHWTIDAVLEHASRTDDDPEITVRYEHADRPAILVRF